MGTGKKVAARRVAIKTVPRQQVLHQVRQAVWRMRSPEGLGQVLLAVRAGLEALQVPFEACEINHLDLSAAPPLLRSHSLEATTDWRISDNEPGLAILLRIWQSGLPAYRPDLEEEDLNQERDLITGLWDHPVRAVLDVPFSHGTLALNSCQPHAFSPADIEVVEEMAQILNEGWSRMEDLQALERRALEAEALAQAIAAVASLRDLDQVLQTVVQQAKNMVGAERATIFLYDEGEGALVPRAEVGHRWEVFRQLRLQPGEDVSGRVFVSGEAVVYDHRLSFSGDTLRPATRSLLEASAQHVGSAGAVVPLKLAGRVVGTLSVCTWQRLCTQRDLFLLDQLATQAVLAIERTQHLQALEKEVAERQRSEAELRASEARLRQAQKLEAVGQLTAGVAHNFNNLLQAVVANLSIAMAKGSPALQPWLQEAESAAMRGAELVRQLMLYTREKTGVFNPQPVDLALVVDSALSLCRKTFDRRLELQAELAPGLPPVLGDASQLQQVLINMYMNARDALEGVEGRAPVIRTAAQRVEQAAPGKEERREYVQVQVQDNGSGMDARTRERIFEPFFTTKEVGKGTGLGLATVYGILERHQGWIECESEVGVGTSFALYLPAAGSPELQGEGVGGGVVRGGSEILLLIDDEAAVRKGVATLFADLGYQVLEAEDGLRGLELARRHRHRIGLVLLDWSMPGLSGREVLRQLRVLDPQLKVMLFSGYAPAQSECEGAVVVVEKPFSIRHLASTVRRVLDTPKGR